MLLSPGYYKQYMKVSGWAYPIVGGIYNIVLLVPSKIITKISINKRKHLY